MSNYVLDTSALLTLHYNEPGSQRVADILVAALAPATDTQFPGVRVFGSFITLMEVLYRV